MAVVVELEDLQIDLAEIDENLIRSDISVVDQGDRFNDRQRIWEAIYPETGWGKARENNNNSKDGTMPSFADHAAEATGVASSTISRLAKVGRCLQPPAARMATPDAIQVFRGPGDENSQDTPDDQMHAKPERLVLVLRGCGDARPD